MCVWVHGRGHRLIAMLPEIWHRAVDGLVTECSTKVLVLGSFGLLLGKV